MEDNDREDTGSGFDEGDGSAGGTSVDQRQFSIWSCGHIKYTCNAT